MDSVRRDAAVHLDTGGRPCCGHPSAVRLDADEAAVTCTICLNLMAGRSVSGLKPPPTLGLRHPDWQLRPHGTRAAYKRHLRRGTRPCEPCLQAERRAFRDRKEAAA